MFVPLAGMDHPALLQEQGRVVDLHIVIVLQPCVRKKQIELLQNRYKRRGNNYIIKIDVFT